MNISDSYYESYELDKYMLLWEIRLIKRSPFMKFLITLLTLLNWSVAMSATQKALIVVTSHKPGWYLSEVTHIYYPLVEAGYKVDFASPEGGAARMDESSRKLDDPENKRFLENKALVQQIAQTKKLDQIKAQDYQIIHFAGGHGAMWDFHNSDALNKLAANIYEQGGIVSAVCHGPAALVNVKLSNGEYLVKGKDVSAFTDSEEAEVKMTSVVPFLLESTLRERGAKMITGKNWQDQSVVSERLVTGQNPQSGHSVGKKIVELAQLINKRK